MGYINKIQIDTNTAHLIEPTLYITPTLSNTAYSATLDNFELVSGATVQAKFTVTNPASATLNVNSTGDKAIYYAGAAILADQFKVNHVYDLVYNGTGWEVIGDIDIINPETQYLWYATCSTAAATRAKVISIPGITELKAGISIRVKFTNAQTYNGQPQINLNSGGAVLIYMYSTTKAPRYAWRAGEIVDFVYDGTYWMMIDNGIADTSYYGITKLSESATSTSTSLAVSASGLNNFSAGMISNAPVYSTSATYAIGDRVRYNFSTWECNTAISTAEAWTAAHWTQLSPLQTQIDNLTPSSIGAANEEHTHILSEITDALDLQAIEALSGTSGLLKKTAANTWSLDTNTYSTTDENVKQVNDSSTSDSLPLLFANAIGNSTVTSTIKKSDTRFWCKPYYGMLHSDKIHATKFYLSEHTSNFATGSNNYIEIAPVEGTVSGRYTASFQSKTGTIALISDIPSVPSWALTTNKPTYTASEVGALPSDTVVTNVSYTNTTSTNSEYPVLFKYSTGNTTTAAGVRFIYDTGKSVTINGSTGNLTAPKINGLTLTSATTGFTISGGTTSKTLTVEADYTLGAACAKAIKTNTTNFSTNEDLPTSKTIASYISGLGYTTNTGTVTSVQVAASDPLQSSTATASNTTLSTTISFKNQDANTILAGPSSGSTTAAPTFRNLVIADLPTITVGKGGTNITSYTIGDILYASASNTLSKLAGNTTTTRKFLRSVATIEGTAVAPVWDTVTKTDVGLSDVENTALSTWTGSSNISTVGTITSGTWQGTAIAADYIGTHTHNYAGSSSAGGPATYLGNIGRLTNMNVNFGSTTYNSKFFISYADGNTTSNKPYQNAIVLNIAWDNTSSNKYGAQIAIGNGTTPHLQLRGCQNGTWDTSWLTVLDSNNYKTYAWARPNSITTDQAIISNGTDGTTTTRGIRNNTSVGALGWTADATDITLVTTNTLKYWDGRYTTTNNASNLEYYKGGAFGTMAKETAADYAKLNSPTFTGTPKSVTPSNNSDGTMIATKAYVDSCLTAADALSFKGVLSATNGSDTEGSTNRQTIPINGYSIGWVYKVAEAGIYAGQECEIGDLVIATENPANDQIAVNNNHWVVIQNNIDGAIYRESNSFVDTHVIIADGANGKVKDSGFTIETSVPQNALFTDEKVTATANTETTFYLIGSSSSSTATGTMLKSKDIYYTSSNTSGNRKSELVLGNDTSSGSSNGRFGRLSLYSTGTRGTYLISEANSIDWCTATLPAKTGTLIMGATTTTTNAIAIYSDTAATLANSTATIDSSGNITATSFIGDLNGNANTATAFEVAPYVKVNLETIYGSGTGQTQTTLNAGTEQVQILGIDGTLQINHGGTGTSSFTANQVIISSDPGQGETMILESRAYSDSSSASALSNTSTNFVTERDIYYGLPTINNAHNYASDSTFYAPTTSGTLNHILVSNGTNNEPEWTTNATLGTDTNGHDIFVLGASSGTGRGKIQLYAPGTSYTEIISQSTTNNNQYILPAYEGSMYATHVESTTQVGGPTKLIYVEANGRITESSGTNGTVGTAAKPVYLSGGTITACNTTVGDAYTPMYSSGGTFTEVIPTQYFTWTIRDGNTGVQLTHAALTDKTFPIAIVVTSGHQHLSSEINWSNVKDGDNNQFVLTTNQVSGDVSGYCIVVRGDTIIPTATPISSST